MTRKEQAHRSLRSHGPDQLPLPLPAGEPGEQPEQPPARHGSQSVHHQVVHVAGPEVDQLAHLHQQRAAQPAQQRQVKSVPPVPQQRSEKAKRHKEQHVERISHRVDTLGEGGEVHLVAAPAEAVLQRLGQRARSRDCPDTGDVEDVQGHPQPAGTLHPADALRLLAAAEKDGDSQPGQDGGGQLIEQLQKCPAVGREHGTGQQEQPGADQSRDEQQHGDLLSGRTPFVYVSRLW